MTTPSMKTTPDIRIEFEVLGRLVAVTADKSLLQSLDQQQFNALKHNMAQALKGMNAIWEDKPENRAAIRPTVIMPESGDWTVDLRGYKWASDLSKHRFYDRDVTAILHTFQGMDLGLPEVREGMQTALQGRIDHRIDMDDLRRVVSQVFY